MKSYGAARSYFSILEFVSWCVIVLGALGVLLGLGTVSQMGRGFGASPGGAAFIAAMLPGAGLAFAGFLGLVLAQIGRAGVDTAEYGQQGLKIARDQLEISRQALKQGANVDPSYAALQVAKEELRSDNAQTAIFADARQSNDKTSEDTNVPRVTHDPGTTLEYRSKTISVVEAGYVFAGTVFPNLERAQERVDESGDALPPKPNEAALEPLVLQPVQGDQFEYQGQTISFRRNRYYVQGIAFPSIEAAKAHIDKYGV